MGDSNSKSAEGNSARSGDPGQSELQRPVLTQTETDSLAPHLLERLEKYANDQEALIAGLKLNHDRFRTESDAKFAELEQKYQEDVSRLEADAKLTAELRTQSSDLELKYNEIATKYRELQTKYFSKDEAWNESEQSLLREKSKLTTENNELLEVLGKRNIEIDRLTNEWKQMSEKLNESNRLRLIAETAAGEAKSEATILQHRESKLKQELEQLQSQKNWFQEQLEEASVSIVSVRKEKSMHVIELQNKLDEAAQQVSCMEQSLELCRKAQVDQQSQIESYILKLRDARDNYAVMEERYRSELAAQDRLISLYKSSSSEGESKVDELMTAVKELQRLLNVANQAYSELEKEKISEVNLLKVDAEKLESRIVELEEELRNANVLLETSRKRPAVCLSDEEVEMISPAAAAASRMLKSGMTLTQIYSEYVSTSEQLQMEKRTNKHLSEELDAILKEVNEKGPIFKRLKLDYDQACQTIAHFSRQYDAAILESEKCRSEADSLFRRNGELTRETDRLQATTKDLSMQVRTLLKELEEARGGVVTYDDVLPSSMCASSSSQFITSNLVQFRSLTELQENNQKLLAVVRELSEKHESKENELSNERADALERELKKAQEEIVELTITRRRQMEMVESIVQQRDMYKSMAESNARLMSTPPVTPTLPAGRSTAASMPVTPVVTSVTPVKVGLSEEDQQILAQAKNSLNQLQEEFTVYRKERAENERMLNQQLDVAQKEASELRMKTAKLASQLEFCGERYKVSTSSTEAQKKEIELLNDRGQRMSELIVKHQQTIALQREELKSVQEKLTKTEVRGQSLATEKEILKVSEARLSQELADIRRDQQSRDLLMLNLQSIQNNLERSEFETKVQYSQRIETLERENAILRKRADGTEDQQKAFVITLERQLAEARSTAELERRQCARVNEQLATANEHIQHLRGEVARLESLLAAAEFHANEIKKQLQQESPAALQAASLEIRELKCKLTAAQSEVENLRAQLESSRQHESQYKEMAESMEQSLNAHNEASQAYQNNKELELAELHQARELLEKALFDAEVAQNELKNETAMLLNEKEAIVKELHDLKAEKSAWKLSEEKADTDLTRQVEELHKQLVEAKADYEAAANNEAIARADCQNKVAEARVAVNKYERELMLHAADVESLTAVKAELEGFSAKLREAENEAIAAQNKLTSAQAGWAEQERLLKKEITVAHERVSGVLAQNNVLHEELQSISERMVQLQANRAQEDSSTKELVEDLTKAGDHQPERSQKLHDVIHYLRREKEIAEAKYDNIEAETNRLRQQTAYLKQQLDVTTLQLAHEREALAVSVQTTAQHAELMRRVETLNLLQDSNQLLREDRDRNVAALKEAQASLARYEVETGPLRDSVMDLTVQRDSLLKETELLQGEVERWKARTSQLIEQCSKNDPEEFKRALVERDQIKREMAAVDEEARRLRLEVAQLSAQLSAQQIETETLSAQYRTGVENLEKQVTEAKAAAATVDADSEEKLKTIAQLRKIGRKYRMQAEEVQKEFDELKAQTAAQQEGRQVDIAGLHESLRASEAALIETQAENQRLRQVEQALNEQLMASSAHENQQQDQIARLSEEQARLVAEQTWHNDERSKLEEQNQAAVVDKIRLAEELQSVNAEKTKISEERDRALEKIQQVGQLASTKIKAGKVEHDRIVAEYEKLKQSLDLERREREKIASELTEMRQRVTDGASHSSAEETDRFHALQSQYEARIAGLENDLLEAQNARRQANDAAQQAEHILIQEREVRANEIEGMIRERTELQSRMNSLQQHVEALQRQLNERQASEARAISERTIGGSTEAQPLRRANIRPIASQFRLTTPVQPVRSSTGAEGRTTNSTPVQPVRTAIGGDEQARASQSAPVQPVRSSVDEARTSQAMPVLPVRGMESWAEPRATLVSVRSGAVETRVESRAMVASIRPMAAAQQQFTPMATVMPTSINVQEMESLSATATLALSSLQSQSTGPQQGRPTQQVQPVSSHVEESTVSSTEDPWWRTSDSVQPSTSKVSTEQAAVGAGGTTPGGTASGMLKRQREDARPIQDEAVETESDAPAKRSRVQMSEVSDTTQTQTVASGATATSGNSTEVDREAVSVAQQQDGHHAVQEVSRRDTEPVTTSRNSDESGISRMTGERDLRVGEGTEEEAEAVKASENVLEGGMEASDDLPDYQEPEASVEYEPSTSRQQGSDMDEQSNQGSTNQYETADDKMTNEGEAQQENVSGTGDESGNHMQFPGYEADDAMYTEQAAADDGQQNSEEDGGYIVQQAIEEDDDEDDDNQGNIQYVISEDDDEEEEEEGAGRDNYRRSENDVREAEADDDVMYEGDLGSEVGRGDSQVDEEKDEEIRNEEDVEEGGGDVEGEDPDQVDDDDDDDVIILDDDVVQVGDSTGGDDHGALGSSEASYQPTTVQSPFIPSMSRPSFTGPAPGDVARHGSLQRQNSQLDRPTPSMAAVVSTQLMPFIFGGDVGGGSGGFEFGDDGIVPSTPTLQVPVRADGFAEAISSPQINEQFRFASSSEQHPQSELAHQGGLGVDTTRMDLAQFDPVASPSSSGAAVSRNATTMTGQVQPPIIFINRPTPPHPGSSCQQDEDSSVVLIQDTSGSEHQQVDEDQEDLHSQQFRSFTETETSATDVSHSDSLGPDESQDDSSLQYTSDTALSQSVSASNAASEDRPSTSEGPGFQAPPKPKIQRIVWKDPDNESASSSGGSQSTSTGAVHRGGAVQSARRGGPIFQRGMRDSRGVYRGGMNVSGAGGIRPLLSGVTGPPQMEHHLQQAQLHRSPMQIARRARGGGRAGVNQPWSNRPPHYP